MRYAREKVYANDPRFLGEAFPDRPADNRLDGTLKTAEEMARE